MNLILNLTSSAEHNLGVLFLFFFCIKKSISHILSLGLPPISCSFSFSRCDTTLFGSKFALMKLNPPEDTYRTYRASNRRRGRYEIFPLNVAEVDVIFAWCREKEGLRGEEEENCAVKKVSRVWVVVRGRQYRICFQYILIRHDFLGLTVYTVLHPSKFYFFLCMYQENIRFCTFLRNVSSWRLQ